MNERVVLIGAGSAVFTRGLVLDMLRREWDLDLALVDTDPEALKVAEGLARKLIEALGAKNVRLRAETDRRKVLKGATVVICTVGVGGRRAWEQDVLIPRKFGVFQPVGDSVMPGGTSRALRMIPAMAEVARDVLDLAPNALFFNYGNPMACVCHGVRMATGAEVVGLCHGVFHVAAYLAKALGVSRESLRYTAVGINHLTWFTEVFSGGADAMPALRRIARQRLGRPLDRDGLGTRFEEAGTAKDGETPAQDNPFSWELFDLFGAFPAVLDRHVCEFFPQFFADGRYYGKTLGVDTYSVEQTVAHGDKRYAEMKADALGEQPLSGEYLKRCGGEHEQVTDIVESIRHNDGAVYSANLPNRGQVPNLPAGAIVESPAIADGGRLKPLQQAPLPAALAGTLATRFQWVETVAEAALEGSREKFIQALVLDGSVREFDLAAKLADALLEAQRPYLPRFFGKEQACPATA
ncbi:MAG: hypothetical protein M5U26_12375 [Planctomycetota bacterium]|nr:hypothetical protein [Planctomycetota bacterium]